MKRILFIAFAIHACFLAKTTAMFVNIEDCQGSADTSRSPNFFLMPHSDDDIPSRFKRFSPKPQARPKQKQTPMRSPKQPSSETKFPHIKKEQPQEQPNDPKIPVRTVIKDTVEQQGYDANAQEEPPQQPNSETKFPHIKREQPQEQPDNPKALIKVAIKDSLEQQLYDACAQDDEKEVSRILDSNKPHLITRTTLRKAILEKTRSRNIAQLLLRHLIKKLSRNSADDATPKDIARLTREVACLSLF